MKFLSGLAVGLLIAVAAYIYAGVTADRTISVPPADWTRGSPAAQAWQELLVSLEAGGARVLASSDDPQVRADGIAHLAQLASAALEMKLAKGDAAQPQLTDWMSDYRKFLGDSPDAVYQSAEISAEYPYEISGNRGDALYMGFTLYGRSLNGWNRVAGSIALDELTLDEQGNFTLRLGGDRPGGEGTGWLPLPDDVHMVMVRQYFHDRPASRPASLTIRALQAAPVKDHDETQVTAGLQRATAFFNDTLAGNLALMDMLAASPNSFDPPRQYNADFGGIFYPTTDNAYFGTWYSLAPEQALVVEGVAPDAAYWSASIQNRWMQSLNYRRYPVSLNNHDIEVDESGRYRLVVSQTDPGVGNWLSTAGTREGLLAIRYQLADGAEPPSMRIVSLAELHSTDN